jgi:hypothetical protein
LKRVTAEEQSRLDLLGGYDAADSPVVKRQASRVEHFRAMLRQITDLPIEQTFVNFAQQLLSDGN